MILAGYIRDELGPPTIIYSTHLSDCNYYCQGNQCSYFSTCFLHAYRGLFIEDIDLLEYFHIIDLEC